MHRERKHGSIDVGSAAESIGAPKSYVTSPSANHCCLGGYTGTFVRAVSVALIIQSPHALRRLKPRDNGP